MSNRKFRDLPLYTGDTSGTYLILNNSSQTTTHKVTKETLFSGFTGGAAGTSGTSGSSGTRGSSGSSGTAGTSGTSGLAGDLYRTTSSTSLTIQTGTTGTFVIGTGLGYSVAQDVIIAYDISNHMVGMVTSYNPSNGQMVVNVHDKIGSGTYTGWTVNLNGAAGGDGSSGTSGTSGTSGSSGSSGDSIFHLSGSVYYTTSSIDIDGNLYITGTTTLGGNIVPKTPRGATLGSLANPFADIFVSSGSINIAGIPGQPNTTLSNVSGAILISAGGMQLVGSASFIAQTGSFQYLSGSFKNVGTFTQVGATIITGALAISGTTTQVGNNNLLGNTTLSGSIIISGSQDSIGTNHLIGDQQLTGSLTVSGSTVQIGNNTLKGNTTLSGSIEIDGNAYHTGSMNILGNTFHVGTTNHTGSVNITGSLYITGSGNGYINSHRILTDLDTGSFVTISGNTNNNVLTATGLSNNIQGESNLQFDGSNLNLTGSEIVNGNVIVTGSLIMDGTLQTNIAATVTNPSNYVLHQFLTSSYHGGTYAFSVHEDSTGKVTVYSNYIVAQGANAITSNIGGDSKLSSGAGAPNPSFAVGFSGSYAQFKVTDTGTFTYRGIVQLY